MFTSEHIYNEVVSAVATSPAVPVDTVTHTPEPCDGCKSLAQGFMTALEQAGFAVVRATSKGTVRPHAERTIARELAGELHFGEQHLDDAKHLLDALESEGICVAEDPVLDGYIQTARHTG